MRRPFVRKNSCVTEAGSSGGGRARLAIGPAKEGVKVWIRAVAGDMFHSCDCSTMRPSVPTRYVTVLCHAAIRGVQGSFNVPWDSSRAVMVEEAGSTDKGASSRSVDRSGLNSIESAFWYRESEETSLVGSRKRQESENMLVSMSPDRK